MFIAAVTTEEVKFNREQRMAKPARIKIEPPGVNVAVVSPDAEVRLSPENSEFRWLPADKARRLASWRNPVEAIDNISAELKTYPARSWVEIKA